MEGVSKVTVGVVLTVMLLDAEQTTFFVVAESTLLKVYACVDDGFTRRVEPVPTDAPPQDDDANQL